MKNPELYYRPSGIAPLKGIALTLLIGIPVALLGGLGYSWCIAKIPFVYIDVILTIVLGLLLGMLTQGLIRMGKIRNVFVSLLLGVLLAAVAVYAKWSQWSVLVDSEIADLGFSIEQTSVLHALLHPMETWEKMVALNEFGLWSIHDMDVNGILLWGVWAVEAGIIFFFLVASTLRQSRLPFSETGNAWIKGMVSPDFILANVPFKAMRLQLEQGDFSPIINGTRTTPATINWTLTYYADETFGEYYVEVLQQKPTKDGKKTSRPEGALLSFTDGKSTGPLRISKVTYEKLRGAWTGEMTPAIPWGNEEKTV